MGNPNSAMSAIYDFPEEQEGLRVTMTAAELAAVMTGTNQERDGQIGTRLWGLVKVLGGGLEMAGGGALLLVPEPTMLTKIGGAALGLHGPDTAAAGLNQVWSGRETRTLTDQAASGLARELGASPQLASNVGTAVDIAIPVAVTMVAGAVRLMAVRGGTIKLAQHEAASASSAVGGHTISRHVAKSEKFLRDRLADMVAKKGYVPPAVSSFSSLEKAEKAISATIRANRTQIEAWAKTGVPVRKAFTFDTGKAAGHGVIRDTGKYVEMTGVKIVFKKETYNGMSYYLLTAHPIVP